VVRIAEQQLRLLLMRYSVRAGVFCSQCNGGRERGFRSRTQPERGDNKQNSRVVYTLLLVSTHKDRGIRNSSSPSSRLKEKEEKENTEQGAAVISSTENCNRRAQVCVQREHMIQISVRRVCSNCFYIHLDNSIIIILLSSISTFLPD